MLSKWQQKLDMRLPVKTHYFRSAIGRTLVRLAILFVRSYRRGFVRWNSTNLAQNRKLVDCKLDSEICLNKIPGKS